MKRAAQRQLRRFAMELAKGELSVRFHSKAAQRSLKSRMPRVEIRPARLNVSQIKHVENLLRVAFGMNRQQARHNARDMRWLNLA